MRTPSALLAALLLTSSLNPSLAVAKGNATLAAIPYVSVPQPCPFGTSGLADNGCSTSTQGQPGSTGLRFNTGRAPGDAFNQMTGTTTNYFVNGPQRNVACIDYTCGAWMPLASMGNPVTALPALYTGGAAGTCTYAATGTGSGGPKITCTPSTLPMPIADYDFTVGGTTCVVLSISGNGTGVPTISDNNWKSNGNCTIDTFRPIMLQITGRPTSRTVITKNTLDSNVLVFPYAYGSCTPGSGLTPNPVCNPTEAYQISGDAQIDHNLFIGFSQRPLQYSAQDASVGNNYEYNGLIGCCSDNVAAHNEFEEYIVAAPGFAGAKNVFRGNTFVATTLHHTNGDAAFPGDLSNVNNVKPIYTVSDNFYLTGAAGGGSSVTPPKFSGTISGNTLTTSAISLGTLGSGMLFTCGTAPYTTSGFPVYPGSTGTTSAGPWGGGNSGSNQITTWPMTFSGAVIQASLATGTLTVLNDPSITLTVGTTVGFGVGTVTIQSFGTGTGGAGTYNVLPNTLSSGAANVGATPVNIYPGGWTVPSSVTCTNVQIQNVTPWSIPFVDVTNNYGQVEISGNYVDMAVYNSGAAGGSQSSNRTSPFVNFGGQIAGTTLTIQENVTSTTVTNGGSSYSPAPTVVYSAIGCLTAPTGTAVLGSGGTAGQVVSITQTQQGIGCGTSAPTVSFTGGGGGSGAAATANIAYPNLPLLTGILDLTGVASGTYLVSGSAPTFQVSINQTVGPILMQETTTICAAPTIWGTSISDPNVDMAGIWPSGTMNSYGPPGNPVTGSTSIVGNNCGP